jgi:hypothetical protein
MPPAAKRGGGLGQREVATIFSNRIMIFGPKSDGTYLV